MLPPSTNTQQMLSEFPPMAGIVLVLGASWLLSPSQDLPEPEFYRENLNKYAHCLSLSHKAPQIKSQLLELHGLYPVSRLLH